MTCFGEKIVLFNKKFNELIPFVPVFYLLEITLLSIILTAFIPKILVFLTAMILISAVGSLIILLFFGNSRAFRILPFILDVHIPFSIAVFIFSLAGSSDLFLPSFRLFYAIIELITLFFLTRR
ncbi:MAG TPA: hypothetical protein PKM07_02725 [Spirochaetota bacterium]|nr:hypothetical protein [Spirochaetota bacterium]